MGDEGRHRRRNRKRTIWFNWPLALGLIVNFAVLALIGSCIIRSFR